MEVFIPAGSREAILRPLMGTTSLANPQYDLIQNLGSVASGAIGDSREARRGYRDLARWRKGVRRKKTETHRKIIRGSRKAYRDGLSSSQAQLVDLRIGQYEVQVRIGKVKGITFLKILAVIPLVSGSAQVSGQQATVVPPKLMVAPLPPMNPGSRRQLDRQAGG
ncbi:hypothetical protein BHE74_00053497 [Ensete ventricosum]|nr:hypothetical protein BHE74_00053497 [Ensete ventricosum]